MLLLLLILLFCDVVVTLCSHSLSLSLSFSPITLFAFDFWLLICAQLKFHSVIAARTSFNYIRNYWPQLFAIVVAVVVVNVVVVLGSATRIDFAI